MLERQLGLEVFMALDRVKEANGITDVAWAGASGLGTSARISEIRRLLAEERKSGRRESKVGRSFTLSKCRALILGLKNLLGEETLNQALMREAEKVQDLDDQLLLMMLAQPRANKEKLKKIMREIL